MVSSACRGVYSSRKSELFPSAKRHLPNPSPNSSPTPKLQLSPNQEHRCLFDIFFFCDDLVVGEGHHSVKCLLGRHREVFGGMCPPQKLENVVFLKLESCNLMNTFGRKFKAGND